MPFIEALCTIPDAFSHAASSQATFPELISRWRSITVLSDAAVSLVYQICEDVTILQRSGISEDSQRKIFHCTRILEPLPNLLQSRLTAPLDQPYTLSPRMTAIYSQFILLEVGHIMKLTNILSSRDIILQATSATLVHEDAAQFLSASKTLTADLLVATPPILGASITKRNTIPLDDDAFIYFSKALNTALRVFATLGDDPISDTSDISRIRIQGTWVVPAIEGISALLKTEKIETFPQRKTEEDLYCVGQLLANTIHTCPNTPDWHQCEKTAALLAKPDIQKHFRTVLDSYSVWYATTAVGSDIDGQPTSTGSVNNSMRGLLIPEHRALPVYGYAVMAEASLYHAISSGVTLDWSQVARNLIDCGDAWMALSINPEVSVANDATKVLGRSFMNMQNAIGGIIGTEYPPVGELSYFYRNPIPCDEVVQILGAVERLAAIAGSATRFLSSSCRGGGGGDGTSLSVDLKLPTMTAVSLASTLNLACEQSLRSLAEDGIVDDEQHYQNVYEVCLGGLETVGKALMLFAAVPSLADRVRLLDDGGYFKPESKDSYDMHMDMGDLASGLLCILKQWMLKQSQDVIYSRWVACGVLTMVQIATARGLLENAIAPNLEQFTMRVASHLVSYCDDVIPNSIMPCDLLGLEAIKERLAVEERERLWPSNIEVDRNYLREHMIEVAEAADPKDLDRLKLRTEVVGLRRCSNLRCTTLRPSSKNPFGKLCVGCKVARYCGPECQLADWEAGHKLICKCFEETPL